MAALTALRSKVQPHVGGCPLPMVDDAILQAVVAFCNRSRAYRYTPADIDVVASTGNYPPTLPDGTEIAWLLEAELDDLPLDTPLPGSIPPLWETDESTPTAAVVVSATQVGLRKIPDASGTLRVRLALRPTQSATTYPDDLHALYQDRIAKGALATLFEMPRQSWSSPELAASARDQFESAISEAEYRADRGSASSPPRTSLCLIGGR
jgi:hypothetical protein